MSKTNNQACTCQARIKAAINTEPSAGHDYVDEIIGLLRVAYSQRDDAERRCLTSSGGQKPAMPKPEELKALASATCSAAAVEKERTLLLWMSEVTAILAYQIDIPHQHKVDLGEALNRYQKSLDAAQQQNDPSSPTAGGRQGWSALKGNEYGMHKM